MKRLIFLSNIIVLLLLAANPGGIAASSASQSVAPTAIVTLKGATGGQPVANLAVQDQAGTDDDSSKCVTFTTPLTIYKGYRRFFLPAGVIRSRVTGLSVKANYKGSASASQTWSWFLYNWSLKTWVKVGTNGAASPNVWTLLTFNTTSPLRFVSAAGEMRLLVQSNNASADAKLDFENINLTYTVPPTPTPTPTSLVYANSSPVYSDSLLNGWGDWSWNLPTHALASTAKVHSGMKAIAVTYTTGWDGLQFGLNNALDVSSYDTLRFWIHGGSAGGQVVQAQVSDGSTTLTQDVTPVANTWTQVDVPLAGLSQVTLLAWFNNTAGAQPVFYVDDVTFVSSGAPTATPQPTPVSGLALSVDVGANRHAISPLIYGMNWADETLAADLDLPVRRWGGNAVTRYNWQNDTENHAVDWFFENIPNDNANPALLPNGSTSDKFVEQDRRTQTKTIMTLPLIGWTPKSRAYICGFSVQKYLAQQSVDSPYHSDCGNGVHTNGTDITGNDPTDTSVAIGPSFDQAWMNHLIGNYGTAANGGVMFYNLDNEPMLWNSSHRDVHPDPVSYDEMRTRTYDYAAAIKATDPGAQILGPAEWGWDGYFYSALDVADGGNWWDTRSDRMAHGDIPFTDWYLQQMQAYETQHGTRILDYLDLHFYPQGNGIFSDSLGSSSVQALRLRSTRALWDPTYVDESWIGQTIYMIPRMHTWVNNNYPNTKIALGEYSWGAMGYMNGALAQADVLGIFGREGLDLAALWDPPTASQPGAYAFRIYRNYDGNHSQFGDTAVNAASADQSQLAVYAAQRSSDSALTLVIINKTAGALNANLTLAGFTPSGNGQVYRYSSANLNAIQHLADQAVSVGGFSANFPANSITLIIIPGSAP